MYLYMWVVGEGMIGAGRSPEVAPAVSASEDDLPGVQADMCSCVHVVHDFQLLQTRCFQQLVSLLEMATILLYILLLL